MKNTLVLFKNPSEEFNASYIENISNFFLSGKIVFSSIEIISTQDEVHFKRILERSKNVDDNLFILASDDIVYDIKKTISEQLNTVFCENENAKSILEKLNKNFNIPIKIENALFPLDATLVPNELGEKQGFLFEDGDFTLCYLPSIENEIKAMLENFVIKYFEQKYDIKREVFICKYFGEKLKLTTALNELKSKYPFIDYSIKESYGDFLVKLFFNGSITKREYDEILRLFITRVGSGVYAEFDTKLENRLFDLLKLRSVKISTAESFTAGRVISSIISNAGASKYVNEGIVCYSNSSKIKRVNVRQESIASVGAVSSKVAYEMALGLLKAGDTDLAISTTGYADSGADEFGSNTGLYFIGVGTNSGIDVYKFRGLGSRQDITETAKNTALYLAITKLKNY